MLDLGIGLKRPLKPKALALALYVVALLTSLAISKCFTNSYLLFVKHLQLFIS